MSDDFPRFAELPKFEGEDERHAWGVFGADDDLGTVNHLTPERVRDAAALIRAGRVINLSLPLDEPSPPLFAGRPAYAHRKEIGRGGRDDSLDSFQLQGSSQWDGLRHVRYRQHGYYQGLQEEDLEGGRIGIDHWAAHGIVGRGVLLDMPRHGAGAGEYRADTRIALDGAMIERIAAAEGVDLRPGDILAIRTGWMRFYFDLDDAGRQAIVGTIRPGGLSCPGLDASQATAAWLWDHQVAALVADNPAVEALPVQNSEFQHRRLIAMLGMAIGELWDLERLADDCAADGVYEFFFCSAPLHIPAAAGSPANAYAIK